MSVAKLWMLLTHIIAGCCVALYFMVTAMDSELIELKQRAETCPYCNPTEPGEYPRLELGPVHWEGKIK